MSHFDTKICAHKFQVCLPLTSRATLPNCDAHTQISMYKRCIHVTFVCVRIPNNLSGWG